MAEKREPPPWAILESERLIAKHISPDQTVPNVQFLLRAVAIALNEAYERGLEEGHIVGKGLS
jgi:hypothetical protein